MTRAAAALAVAALAVAACDTTRPIEPPAATGDCTACHGAPPATVASGAAHPASTQCSVCHSGTVNGDDATIVAGGLHMNGTVEAVSCGGCHALPPATGPTISGQTAHPFHVTARAQGCATCHPVPPAATHDDGAVNVVVQSSGGPVAITGWDCTTCHEAIGVAAAHALPFVSAHTTAALANLASCQGCHGADYGGGTAQSCTACHQGIGYADWKTNCTFCHGTRTSAFGGTPVWLPAPPQAVAGATSTSDARVGAHQKHLGNGSALSNGVACGECHPAASDLSHVGGTGVAQLAWGPLATTGGAAASMTSGTCANYCHGATLPGTGRARPAWAPPTAMTCGSCHQANPTTGQHPAQNTKHSGIGCGTCHGTGFAAGSVNRALHVDGAINKAAGLNWQDTPVKSCDPSCHARENW